MNGDTWAFLGVALASLLGSTGLAGLLGGGLELSRGARLRREINKSISLLERLSPGSPAHNALSYRVEEDTIWLSAAGMKSLRGKMPPVLSTLLSIFGLVLYTGISAFALSAIWAPDLAKKILQPGDGVAPENIPLVLWTMGLQIVSGAILVSLIQAATRRQERDFFATRLRRGESALDAVREHALNDEYANRQLSLWNLRTRVKARRRLRRLTRRG